MLLITFLIFSLLLITSFGVRSPSSAGSSLFYNRRYRTTCWSKNELAKLRARKVFEQLTLPMLPPDKVDERYLKHTLKYLRNTMKQIEKSKDHETREILRDALADTIGDNLRSNLLPIARFAYYAGYVRLRGVRQLHDYSDEMKHILNTQGLGWKVPERLPGWSNLSVAKITIGSGKLVNPCTYLTIKRDANHCINLPLPQLDDSQTPSAIALPFKTVKVFSITAPISENVLLKYYTTASRCILQKSPKKCRHSDFVNFNNEMWHWMKTDVAPHLLDEKLYSAFGGVLRIAAAVQSYGRGLTRRTALNVEESNQNRSLPYLMDNQVSLDSDWTPTVYICFTILASLLIFLLQMFYGKIFAKGTDGCNCAVCPANAQRPRNENQVYYAKVDTNFPALLPQYPKAEVFLREKPTSTQKTSSRSLETHTVYDLNENKRKVMEIPAPVSDRGSSMSDESTSKGSSKASYDSGKNTSHSNPPQIETPMCQLKIARTPANTEIRCKQMYSKREHPVQTDHASASSWSDSEGSGSTRSSDSVSSRSSSRSKSSRGLEWAKRVVSKHSLQRSSYSKTPSGADLDGHSYTTPPSGR